MYHQKKSKKFFGTSLQASNTGRCGDGVMWRAAGLAVDQGIAKSFGGWVVCYNKYCFCNCFSVRSFVPTTLLFSYLCLPVRTFGKINTLLFSFGRLCMLTALKVFYIDMLSLSNLLRVFSPSLYIFVAFPFFIVSFFVVCLFMFMCIVSLFELCDLPFLPFFLPFFYC